MWVLVCVSLHARPMQTNGDERSEKWNRIKVLNLSIIQTGRESGGGDAGGKGVKTCNPSTIRMEREVLHSFYSLFLKTR